MYFIYTFVLSLGLILTCPYYLFRFRRYLPTIKDRFGLLQIPQLRDAIWVHAVSVGEVKAVEKLLERHAQPHRRSRLSYLRQPPPGRNSRGTGPTLWITYSTFRSICLGACAEQ